MGRQPHPAEVGEQTGQRGLTGKGHERRLQILHAATQQLIEAGYAGFSTRQVAERLGLRLSNVQYYFPTREALLEALLAGVLADALAEFGRHPAEHDLASLVRFVLAGQTPQACRLFLELWALAARDAGARSAMDGFYLAYRKEIEQAVAKVAPGIGGAERARRAALIMALLEGVSLFRHPGGAASPGMDTAIIEAVRRMARGGEMG
ncbi:MAG: TetR/AcrR family transcriptional regulator [Aquabacterium sp.]|uniref:TetR/AcrR family transcriptional regulator n=1 Tax=Aquabacterium sp. TaxID=1872578 RepID=UPI002723E771|nr:TetR/AcrR family transcriptional regulator [Aquabacterium sp.]MDO9002395.1 TetR/AcrR family transcriptional regulator [Aquabacterium sp.]